MDYLRLVLIYLAWAVLGAYALAGLAAPQDDYQEGRRAYQRADMGRAMSLLKKAADTGHAPAQALFGVVMEKTGNNEEAVAYYRKAADQGDADGQFSLGMMLMNGSGIKKDVSQARAWITRAAENGHVEAINVLAEAHMRGERGPFGAKPEPEQGLRWVRRAADNNYLPAVDYFARAYRSGAPGVVADAKQAERYEARAKKLRGVAAKPEPKTRK